MRFHVLKRSMAQRWRRPGVRIITVVSLLLIIVFAQYKFVNMPAPISVDAVNPKITPLKVLSRSQKLLIEDPVSSATGILATHRGKKYEIVEAHFDKARLAEETSAVLRYFERQIGRVPEGDHRIDLIDRESTASTKSKPTAGGAPELTLEEERELGNDTCRTDITLNWSGGVERQRELYFYQADEPGLNSYRSFEMEVKGADLIVSVNTMIPPGVGSEGRTTAPGCAKLLQIGDWTLPISAPREIRVVASRNSNLRFRFSSYQSSYPIWDGGVEGSFEPFAFEPKPFSIRALGLLNLANASQSPALNVRSGGSGSSIVLNRVLAGSDYLSVDYSGQAYIQESGQFKTIDLLDRLKKYPIIAGFMAMTNTAILGWLVVVLRGVFRTSR
jgi:hypothetical protein